MPAGGAYNREPELAITGNFSDHGAPRCRFGSSTTGWIGTSGSVLNSTHAVCRKPRLPDSLRDAVGAYAVAFSPNGQCFADGSRASFQTYNTQVNESVAIRGLRS